LRHSSKFFIIINSFLAQMNKNFRIMNLILKSPALSCQRINYSWLLRWTHFYQESE
jgi:hypothetical protein